MESLLLTSWGILYGVSLGWSFFNLLNQWPRLIRFGSMSILSKQGALRRMMLSCWGFLFILVFISFSSIVYSALEFDFHYWNKNNGLFAIVVALIALVALIMPFFINRAVWGFALFVFPFEFKKFVSKKDNKRYWVTRVTIKTTQKLYMCPKYGGFWITSCSTFIIILYSFFIYSFSINLLGSLFIFFNTSTIIHICLYIVVLLISLMLHYPWPDNIEEKKENLPPVLRGNLNEKLFRDSEGNNWLYYIIDLKACLKWYVVSKQNRCIKVGFCRENFEDFYEIDAPCEISTNEENLRSLLEKAMEKPRFDLQKILNPDGKY